MKKRKKERMKRNYNQNNICRDQNNKFPHKQTHAYILQLEEKSDRIFINLTGEWKTWKLGGAEKRNQIFGYESKKREKKKLNYYVYAYFQALRSNIEYLCNIYYWESNQTNFYN